MTRIHNLESFDEVIDTLIEQLETNQISRDSLLRFLIKCATDFDFVTRDKFFEIAKRFKLIINEE